ncbi:MAG: hypothetical protein A2270_00730 [Elusimicrobia bacterium RIFOXYA12_FULL_51_18]|nr:MAG: hypothetical protein A2270_00730 [Elusimicrobia bacterium RIFOXYA12_FULL_51_18]OGS29022.1 MAG: hypothetical protein A2218_08745 [Elusimicrobia bacterium RIFOXYA2_FULL_53_38]
MSPRRPFIALAFLSAAAGLLPAAAEDYSFDVSETEKKPYSLNGYAEFRPVLAAMDRDAALYKLKFHNHAKERTTYEYNSKLQLEGSYQRGISRAYLRINSDLNNTYQGWDRDLQIYEGYLSVKPSSEADIIAGKKVMRWGKGYAWNPAALIDRPKNPDDPELPLEGYAVLSADYTRSFNGQLKTASVTPVILPVYEHLNNTFGSLNHLDFACKAYFLYYDTDIDLIYRARGSKPAAYGADFSRNISTNFEVHGEAALIADNPHTITDKNGNTTKKVFDAKSYLLGLRYQTEKDATYIAEYYHNGGGFSDEAMTDYFSFVDAAYVSYTGTGSAALMQKAADLSNSGYGAANPMREYFYLRVIQQEPFKILYFTPALTTMINAGDNSFSIAPETVWTRVTNLELRLKAIFLAGSSGTEFGEKAGSTKVELRAKYYF